MSTTLAEDGGATGNGVDEGDAVEACDTGEDGIPAPSILAANAFFGGFLICRGSSWAGVGSGGGWLVTAACDNAATVTRSWLSAEAVPTPESALSVVLLPEEALDLMEEER